MKLKISKEENELMTFVTYRIMFAVKLACVAVYDLLPAAVADNIYSHEIKRKLNLLVRHTDIFDDHLRQIYNKRLDYFNSCYAKFNYQVSKNVDSVHSIISKKYEKRTFAQIEVAINLLRLAQETYEEGMKEVHKFNPKMPYLPFFEVTSLLCEVESFGKLVGYREGIQDKKCKLSISFLKSKINCKKIIFYCVNEKKEVKLRYWTEKEVEFVKDYYRDMATEEMEEILGRSKVQIKGKFYYDK